MRARSTAPALLCELLEAVGRYGEQGPGTLGGGIAANLRETRDLNDVMVQGVDHLAGISERTNALLEQLLDAVNTMNRSLDRLVESVGTGGSIQGNLVAIRQAMCAAQPMDTAPPYTPAPRDTTHRR
jgi:hypothetical protein